MNTLTAYSLLLAIIITLIMCFIIWAISYKMGVPFMPGVVLALIISLVNNYIFARNLLQLHGVK